MITKQKRAAIERLETDAIERIVAAHAPEPSTPERPLAGMVQITGIGQVTIRDLKQILAERRTS